MKKIKNFPTVSGANTRPVNKVDNLENLKLSGIAFATYGMREGDVIEFPDTMDDVDVFEQPVRVNSNIVQNLLGVLRNGKADYISLGTLRKQDVNREYTCDFTKEMGALNNDYERIQSLLGKKIKATGSKTIKVQAFDRLTGQRLEGQTTDQVVPIIEYE